MLIDMPAYIYLYIYEQIIWIYEIYYVYGKNKQISNMIPEKRKSIAIK